MHRCSRFRCRWQWASPIYDCSQTECYFSPSVEPSNSWRRRARRLCLYINNNQSIIIIIPGQCLWCCHHAVAALREFTLVHAMSATRRQVAADLWTKPMACHKPAYRLPVNYTLTITHRVGIVGVWGLNPPPVHVYRRSFLRENWLWISIPGQNFKHFDIRPPVLLGQFQHCHLPCFNKVVDLWNGMSGVWVLSHEKWADFESTNIHCRPRLFVQVASDENMCSAITSIFPLDTLIGPRVRYSVLLRTRGVGKGGARGHVHLRNCQAGIFFLCTVWNSWHSIKFSAYFFVFLPGGFAPDPTGGSVHVCILLVTEPATHSFVPLRNKFLATPVKDMSRLKDMTLNDK